MPEQESLTPGWFVQPVRSSPNLVFLTCDSCWETARPIVADPMTDAVLAMAARTVNPCPCKLKNRKAA